jgi:predicted permease
MTLEHLGQDLRYGLRALRKDAAFTATAVLSLALGIGANTAIFTLIDALLLRWLPVRGPQGLIQLQFQTDDRMGGSSFSYSIAKGLAERKDIFANLAGFSSWSSNVGSPGSATRVPGALVTGEFYTTLGLNPALGRLLVPEDDQPGAPLVAVLSHGYWRRQYVGSPDVVGQTILLNGIPVTIAGVSPPGFVGANVGSVADITIAVAALPRITPEAAGLLGPGNFWLRILARPAVSIPETKARLAAEWSGLSESVVSPVWPSERRKALAQASFELVAGGTGWSNLRATFQQPLLVLMAVVGLVLLIACANVANLLLARSAARQREIAVRLAIGAGRGRVLRQLLTESVMLAVSGAALGIGLAWLTCRALLNILSSGPQKVVFDLTPNMHVLAFTSALAVATAILFGLAPAFQTTAPGLRPALKEDSRASHSRSRMLSSLASIQVALSLVLLIGAGLFVRTLRNLQDLDPGFKREGVMLVDLEARRTVLPKEILGELQSVPGVISVSVSTHTPLSGSTWSEPAVPKGQAIPQRDNAFFIGAGPRFFETLQTPLIAGREFTERDVSSAPDVAVINEAFASRHFPAQNAVGQYLSAIVRGRKTDLQIVGVVKNSFLAGLRRDPPPAVYVAYYQLPRPNPEGKSTANFPTTLEIRAAGSLARVSADVRTKLQAILPTTPIEVRALEAQVEATLVQERLLATVAGVFGLLALILACIGLYGLLAYSVARRTKELGIRMALGARRHKVIAAVTGKGMGLALLGIVPGVPVAFFASRWVESMLFGLTHTDTTTVLGAAVALLAAAVIAAYFPARRAAAVDPITALRDE